MNFLAILQTIFAVELVEETSRERLNRLLGRCIVNLGQATGIFIEKAKLLKKIVEEQYDNCMNKRKKPIKLEEEKMESDDRDKFIERLDETIKKLEKEEKSQKEEDVQEFEEKKVLDEEAEHLQEKENEEMETMHDNL